MNFKGWWIGLAAVLVLAAPVIVRAQFAAPSLSSTYSIPQAQQIEPEAMNRLLVAGAKEKPLVLQVGSHLMFAQAHIPGSEYAGAGSRPDGLQQLAARVAKLGRKTAIVLYCGCCPWDRCPNMGPAYAKLKEMGFTNVKALHMATNFGTDWAAKGYPVETGR